MGDGCGLCPSCRSGRAGKGTSVLCTRNVSDDPHKLSATPLPLLCGSSSRGSPATGRWDIRLVSEDKGARNADRLLLEVPVIARYGLTPSTAGFGRCRRILQWS